MDSAIIDPIAEDMRAAIYATEALLGQDNYCMNYLSAFRDGKIGQQ
jgi:5-methyltetrahydrofolate--homocysteine methyltransferase